MRKLTKTEYNTIHVWVLRHNKKTGVCEHCKRIGKKTQWSNKSGNYIKKDATDWQELCIPCHYKYDSEVLQSWNISKEKRREIGRLGGLKKTPFGGFGSKKVGSDGLTGNERASIVGKIGGSKSRRR